MVDETREQIQERLARVQSRIADLQGEVSLTSVQKDIEQLTTSLALLPGDVEKLRARGYVFRNYLEQKAGVLAEKWDATRTDVVGEARRRSARLERELDEAQKVVRQASAFRASTVDRASAIVDGLEQHVDGARSALKAMYNTLKQNVEQSSGEVTELSWMLDQLDEAGFQPYPAEDLVAACKAQYLETKKDGPSGVLFLTDERLIFERKEKVAKKKILFIAVEKEMVQEVLLDLPVGQIEESKATDKGLFGGKEFLELTFAPEADFSGATLRLRGARNEDWVGTIGRVQSGEISKQRTTPKDQEAVEAAQSAPTKCPYCGATLEITVVRGMREITCEYCGSVIRL